MCRTSIFFNNYKSSTLDPLIHFWTELLFAKTNKKSPETVAPGFNNNKRFLKSHYLALACFC
ncbi:hypothetical protein predicted by Glimmer/Critica [Bdellovibrio bacteriovorus HD100]|uniref:Uncharacterized protein n=1 Tax=Bdellovibrio bacteriovorus (strain ATCC 15356 / DSM 50701 / NCIMB 9529 / HD100) TaxID=264462 RepID=Q6MP93_BDEBA|nr:hypothetical protein predicted by Glimmer/Critica [Bdellovibrio bacteriovorus HD100]